PDKYVNITVSDNGIGFEDKYNEKIFGIFQRLHGRNYEGTGIGLAIARKIIENHGGFIFANGKVNKGAKFQILLPLKSARSYSRLASV
ncbi:MAG TPA: ATP-binding protein, partial [Chryseolinea sp.]